MQGNQGYLHNFLAILYAYPRRPLCFLQWGFSKLLLENLAVYCIIHPESYYLLQ